MTKRKSEKTDAAEDDATGAATAASADAPPEEHQGFAAPSRCRIVEFTDGEGNISPAIVTKVEFVAENKGNDPGPGRQITQMDVCAFDPVFGARNYYIADARVAVRQSPGEPNTWNWPARS